LQTVNHALKMELFRRSYDMHTSGNSSIDTSLIRDIYWSFVWDLCHHEIRGWWWWWWWWWWISWYFKLSIV